MSANPSQNLSNWASQESTSPTFGNSQEYVDPDGRRQDVGHFPALSGDELRTLKECNRESFFYRCIPLSTLFSGLAFIGMKNGYLQKNPKYGYIPKILAGVALGYIAGKFSYRKQCMEKILKLSNSRLADAIRKNKGLSSVSNSSNANFGFTAGSPLADFSKEGLVFKDHKPDFSDHDDGIDSYNKVTESLSPYTESEAKSEKSYISYDDLRRTNREEYNNKMSDKHRKQTPGSSIYPESSFGSTGSSPNFTESSYPSGPSLRDDPSSTSSSRPDPYFNPQKNKYGDVWDD